MCLEPFQAQPKWQIPVKFPHFFSGVPMKAKITQLLAVFLFAAIAGPTFAADEEVKEGTEAVCPSAYITSGVKLTDDQKVEIKKHVAIHLDALAKANANPDKEARKEARKATNKKFRKAVLSLLTHDQKAEINAKRRAAKTEQKESEK